MDEKIYDTTIIGGGPSGLFTAFYAGMREISVKILESLPELGGQLTALYPEKKIYDVGGVPEITGRELVDTLIEQAYTFNADIELNETVNRIEKITEQKFKIITNKTTHYSKTIIITAGAGAFEPKKLELKNPKQHNRTNIHYAVKNLKDFEGKKVFLSGGGDSAVDWALTLEPIAKKVTLVHRRNIFRAHERKVKQLVNSSVEILTPFIITALEGEGSHTKQVRLEEKGGTLTIDVDVDEIIVNHGFKSSLKSVKNWNLKMYKNSIIVDANMETNIKGIYAAGDITTYQSKLKLITLGFAEGPIAVSNVKHYLDPKSRLQPGHSTHIFAKN